MYQEWPFFRTFLSNVQVFTNLKLQRLMIDFQCLKLIMLTQNRDTCSKCPKLERHFDIVWGLSSFLSWFNLTKHVTNKIRYHSCY